MEPPAWEVVDDLPEPLCDGFYKPIPRDCEYETESELVLPLQVVPLVFEDGSTAEGLFTLIEYTCSCDVTSLTTCPQGSETSAGGSCPTPSEEPITFAVQDFGKNGPMDKLEEFAGRQCESACGVWWEHDNDLDERPQLSCCENPTICKNVSLKDPESGRFQRYKSCSCNCVHKPFDHECGDGKQVFTGWDTAQCHEKKQDVIGWPVGIEENYNADEKPTLWNMDRNGTIWIYVDPDQEFFCEELEFEPLKLTYFCEGDEEDYADYCEGLRCPVNTFGVPLQIKYPIGSVRPDPKEFSSELNGLSCVASTDDPGEFPHIIFASEASSRY